jgi:hypothetical protein
MVHLYNTDSVSIFYYSDLKGIFQVRRLTGPFVKGRGKMCVFCRPLVAFCFHFKTKQFFSVVSQFSHINVPFNIYRNLWRAVGW